MKNVGYSKNDIQMLHELTKIQNNRQLSEKVRSNKYSQGGKTSIDIWPSHMQHINSKGNNINEKVQYNYVNVQIGMPVFVDDIATI